MFTVPPEDHYLNSSATADFLQISEKTLEDWRHRGVGPEFVRIGHRSVRYRLGTLQRWLGDRTVKSPDDCSASGEALR